jgi:hypothetical protein
MKLNRYKNLGGAIAMTQTKEASLNSRNNETFTDGSGI